MTDILNDEKQIREYEFGFLAEINKELDLLYNKYAVSDAVIIKYIELKENIYLRYIDNLFRKQQEEELRALQLEKIQLECQCRKEIADADRLTKTELANVDRQLQENLAAAERANRRDINTDNNNVRISEANLDRALQTAIANLECECKTNIANQDRQLQQQKINSEKALLQAQTLTQNKVAEKTVEEKVLLMRKAELAEHQKFLVDREKTAYDDDRRKVKAQFLGEVAQSAISVDSTSASSAMQRFNDAINSI